MGLKPILTFDTSGFGGHGCLASEPDLDALITGLTAGFHTRLTFTSVSEIIATTSGEGRRRQIDVCRRLLGSGDCVDPPHIILSKLVRQFEQSLTFDCTVVDIAFPEAESQIAAAMDFDDVLSRDERNEVRENEKLFLSLNQQTKPAFDRIFAQGGTPPPVSVSEFMQIPEVDSLFWRTATGLYERAAEKPTTQETVRRFLEMCPPFKVLMTALFVTLHDRAVRPPDSGPTRKVGRNDTFMAVYLPYCDHFVSNDIGQLNCLTETLSICGSTGIVGSYASFRAALLLPTFSAALSS